jgi:hypothetical protein
MIFCRRSAAMKMQYRVSTKDRETLLQRLRRKLAKEGASMTPAQRAKVVRAIKAQQVSLRVRRIVAAMLGQ